MAELTINELIKIILGVTVVVGVAYLCYRFFGNSVYDFFKNLKLENKLELILPIL